MSAERVSLLDEVQEHLAEAVRKLETVQQLEQQRKKPLHLADIICTLGTEQLRIERRSTALLKRG